MIFESTVFDPTVFETDEAIFEDTVFDSTVFQTGTGAPATLAQLDEGMLVGGLQPLAGGLE